jgi:hypothetical protein
MFGVNDWLRCRLMSLLVCIIVAGFVATNLKSYCDAVNALKSTILHDALPLIGSDIYSEVQADLIRPVFIFSQMAKRHPRHGPIGTTRGSPGLSA